ncbi:MAG: hypothetical protein QOE76_3377 [Frankiales bacterium]|nr:hypothetical protein [Frankiales bacterium]
MTAGQYDGSGTPPGAAPPPPPAPPVLPPAPGGPYQPWLDSPAPTFDAEQPQQTLAAPRTMRDRWQKLSGGIAAAFAALWKLKILAFLVKLKFLLSFGTFFLSFAAYAWFYGWQFGLGLVVLILVHELGHMAVFKARGVDVSLPTFTILGAYVKARPKTVYDSVLGGLAGPGFGALGALAALAVWNQNDQPLYRALASFGFLMNLFNLAPLGFLDGGNIWRALRGQLTNGPGSARAHVMSPEQRRVVWAIYVALIVVLGYATKVTYFQRNFS